MRAILVAGELPNGWKFDAREFCCENIPMRFLIHACMHVRIFNAREFCCENVPMRVRMHVCMYVCTDINSRLLCTGILKYVGIGQKGLKYGCVYECMCMREYIVYMFSHIHAHVHTYTAVVAHRYETECVCLCVHTCVSIYNICTCIFTHIFMDMHAPSYV